MLATDCFAVESVWLQCLHALFFIEIASRTVHLAGVTDNPTGEWAAQQARNLAWRLQDGALKAKFLLRDRDSKFAAAFVQIFHSESVKVVKLPLSVPSGQLDRGEIRRHLPLGGARPLADLQRQPPGGSDQGVPGSLQPCATAPWPRTALPRTSRSRPRAAARRRPDRPPRPLGRVTARVLLGRLIDLTEIGLPHTSRSIPSRASPHALACVRCASACWKSGVRSRSSGLRIEARESWSAFRLQRRTLPAETALLPPHRAALMGPAKRPTSGVWSSWALPDPRCVTRTAGSRRPRLRGLGAGSGTPVPSRHPNAVPAELPAQWR